MRSLSIIGCGKVGKTLGYLWQNAQSLNVESVVNRNIESGEAAVKFIGHGKAVSSYSQLSPSNLIMISSSDSAIPLCAEALLSSNILAPNSIVFHCSGALSSDLLFKLESDGIQIASLHPVKSFTDLQLAVDTFSGTFCALEGDPCAVEILSDLVEQIGGQPFVINSKSKGLYHGGNVIVCNYLSALMEFGLRAYESSGVSRTLATDIIKPLVRETIENIFNLGPAKALTGPIARGDAKVVEDQISKFREQSVRDGALYQLLGTVALELVKERAELGDNQILELEKLLINGSETKAKVG